MGATKQHWPDGDVVFVRDALKALGPIGYAGAVQLALAN